MFHVLTPGPFPSIDSLCYSSHLSVLPTERQRTTRLPCYCQSGLRPHRDSLYISNISKLYRYIIYNMHMYSTELTFDNHSKNNCLLKWYENADYISEQLYEIRFMSNSSYQGQAECIYMIYDIWYIIYNIYNISFQLVA